MTHEHSSLHWKSNGRGSEAIIGVRELAKMLLNLKATSICHILLNQGINYWLTGIHCAELACVFYMRNHSWRLFDTLHIEPLYCCEHLACAFESSQQSCHTSDTSCFSLKWQTDLIVATDSYSSLLLSAGSSTKHFRRWVSSEDLFRKVPEHAGHFKSWDSAWTSLKCLFMPRGWSSFKQTLHCTFPSPPDASQPKRRQRLFWSFILQHSRLVNIVLSP